VGIILLTLGPSPFQGDYSLKNKIHPVNHLPGVSTLATMQEAAWSFDSAVFLKLLLNAGWRRAGRAGKKLEKQGTSPGAKDVHSFLLALEWSFGK
jgi:hypothetical protein